MNSYPASNLYAKFLKIYLSIDVAFWLLSKISCSKHVDTVFNYSKKDRITRLVPSWNLKNGVG